MGQLIALRLVDQAELAPYSERWRNPIPTLTREAVTTLCALPDPPPTIVAALRTGAALPPGIEGNVLRLPTPEFAVAETDAGVTWQRIEAFAVIRCSKVAPAKS
jgi:hypothetical protein